MHARPSITALNAHRGNTDENWRLDRLAEVSKGFGVAAAKVDRWRCVSGALVSLYDHKGSLTAVWRSIEDSVMFRPALLTAWHGVEEFTPINHQLSQPIMVGSPHRKPSRCRQCGTGSKSRQSASHSTLI